MTKVSVIVPVYNAGQYIEKCIESLVHQTLPDIEIIAVDDGSTDLSPDILNNLAVKYNNIKIITLQNSGVSAARNAGMRAASGEYI